MNKIIKAELYKYKRLTSFWIFIICIFLWYLLLLITFSEKNPNIFIQTSLGYGSLFFVVVMAMSAMMIGHGFSQRTHLYEIMSGNRPMKIIISKIISSGLIVATIVSLIHLLYIFFILLFIDGNITNQSIYREILFITMIYRCSIVSVLLTLIFRSNISILISYIILEMEMIILLIYGLINNNFKEIMEYMESFVGKSPIPRIFNILFTSIQIQKINSIPVNSEVVTDVILGFVITVSALIFITYRQYKKKDF